MHEPDGILIVDDEKDFARGISRLLAVEFPEIRISVAHSGDQALELMRSAPYFVVITDLNMPGMDGRDLMQHLQAEYPQTSVVMLTAYGTIELAVEAVKQGGYDFLTKPVEPQTLYRVAGKAMERARLMGENSRLRDLLKDRSMAEEMVGDSPAMRRVRETLAAVAQSDYTVLIRGESGTGKELAARYVHKLSRRNKRKMLTVNCPAIPDQLLESELFGHVKGAFTGANKDRRGLFEAASGGTLLLDEIGDIGSSVQTKLLRCLQEQEIRPVGSDKSVQVDVRIVASTNRELEEHIQSGSFREDLFYRLNVLTVNLPPLRERLEDIPMLAVHFLARTNEELKGPHREFDPDVLAFLGARPWPGNVRELQNFVRRLAVFALDETIGMRTVRLVESQANCATANCELSSYKEAKNAVVDEFTRTYVETLLKNTSGNVSEAARISGLTRVALQKILKRLGINAERFR